MENKSTSGQRGICAWMAYLVMRNVNSRQRKNIEDGEKISSVRGKGDREDE